MVIKKIILGLLMVLLTVSMTSATTTNHVTVDCGSNSWWDWNGNVCRDYELQDEFNQVTGFITDNEESINNLGLELDANNRFDNHQERRLNRINHKVRTVKEYVFDNENSWSTDGRGVSMGSVKRFLFGDFKTMLDDLFVTKESYSLLEDRVYELEAITYFLSKDIVYDDAMVSAKVDLLRNGRARIASYDCVNNLCFKIGE